MNRIAHPTLILIVLALTSAALAAQERPAPQPPQQIPVFQETADARATRVQLLQILRQHPPAVGEVLQRDPSLLTRADYLSPYPVLWAFLQKHPEIARRFERRSYIYVHGNHDLVAGAHGVPDELFLQADGQRILFTHGHQQDDVKLVGFRWTAGGSICP